MKNPSLLERGIISDNPAETEPDDFPPCGMIFEFKTMEAAEAFAAKVKQRFGIASRVFDNAEAAERSHMYPWAQHPPVVHVDRPWWGTEPKTPEWDEAWALEPRVNRLAKQFGGRFVGT